MNGVGGCVISEDGDQTEDELKAWMSIRGGRRFTERVSCPNLGGELAGEVNSPTGCLTIYVKKSHFVPLPN